MATHKHTSGRALHVAVGCTGMPEVRKLAIEDNYCLRPSLLSAWAAGDTLAEFRARPSLLHVYVALPSSQLSLVEHSRAAVVFLNISMNPWVPGQCCPPFFVGTAARPPRRQQGSRPRRAQFATTVRD